MKKLIDSHEFINHVFSINKPQMAYDQKNDFNKWRKNAKEKLLSLLGLPFEKCDDLFKITSEEVYAEYKKIDFEFQSEKDYFINASILVPEKIKKPAPVSICIQGHSTGKHISLGISEFDCDEELIAGGRDFAVRAVKEGFCAVAFDLRYMGEAGRNEEGKPSCADTNTSMATLLLGRTAIGERVWDITRIIDVVTKYFSEYVDTDKIICMGNSGGGTATFYASCIDERIRISMPSCSFCTYDDSIIAMHHCPCNYIPGIRKYFNMGDLACLIAPRAVVFVCGIEDDIFPIKGVEESFETVYSCYKEMGKEHLCHIVKGNGGHRFYPDEAWQVVHKLI